jgi:hypothetical protein
MIFHLCTVTIFESLIRSIEPRDPGYSGVRTLGNPAPQLPQLPRPSRHSIITAQQQPVSLPTNPSGSLSASHKMGNIFSQSPLNDPSANPSSSSLGSSTASAAALKQTIAQNMRLSKSKVSSLLKANHMHYSIVHRNHFYNTLPHVRPPPRVGHRVDLL